MVCSGNSVWRGICRAVGNEIGGAELKLPCSYLVRKYGVLRQVIP